MELLFFIIFVVFGILIICFIEHKKEKDTKKYYEELRRKQDFQYLINSSYKPPKHRTYKPVKAEKYESYSAKPKTKPAVNKNKEYVREPISKSMRYDVLSRDNFRCCICGRSAEDGVKLHIDHIYPVSKGGKTEISNLRTLCADCNLGKSNKIEPKKEISDYKNKCVFQSYSELAEELHKKEIVYIDKTASNGNFWILSTPEHDDWIKTVKVGAKTAAAAKSSKALGGRPGWYI